MRLKPVLRLALCAAAMTVVVTVGHDRSFAGTASGTGDTYVDKTRYEADTINEIIAGISGAESVPKIIRQEPINSHESYYTIPDIWPPLITDYLEEDGEKLFIVYRDPCSGMVCTDIFIYRYLDGKWILCFMKFFYGTSLTQVRLDKANKLILFEASGGWYSEPIEMTVPAGAVIFMVPVKGLTPLVGKR